MKKIFVNLAIVATLVAPLAIALPATAAVPNWDITGTWNLDFDLGGGHYLHTMTVSTFNTATGAFSGTGVYSADPSYTWTVTGTVSGYDVAYHILYTGMNAGYTVDTTGTIAPGGASMSGNWASNASQSGTWVGTGPATAVVDACPADTTPVLVETKTVDSASSVSTPSSNVLLSGNNYLLVSSGAWENVGKNVADAEYASVDNWATHMDGYNIAPYFLGAGEFDLQVDGTFVNWGGYNPTHEYSHLYAGTGNPVNFLIFDGDSTVPQPIPNSGWYGDNSGSLSVNIYSCVPNTPPVTTGTISGMKYNDLNRNGKRDDGEPGLSGWVIRLISDNDAEGGEGTTVATATTNADGNYSFQNVTPGTYEVRETHQKGWKRMSKNPKDIVITAGSEVAGVNFGNAVKQKKDKEDTDKDDNRDEQSGEYYANHGRSDYGRNQNDKDHQQKGDKEDNRGGGNNSHR